MGSVEEIIIRDVKDAQEWLNYKFEGNHLWVHVDTDGVAGYNTMVAFVRALQILLGIDVDGGFGNGTKNAFNAFFPDGLGENTNLDSTGRTIVALVNLALLCRIEVSNTDDIYKFSSDTRQGITSTMNQLGIENFTGNLSAREVKALFTSDAYYLVDGGDSTTREIQQEINRKYSNMLDKYIPTNGIYDRNMNTALIKMIQYEIGAEVDGGWGEGTMSSLPVLGPSSSRTELVYILQYLLYLNGFNPNGFDGGFGNGVTTALKDFQSLMRLDVDGYCGRQAWAALVVSCGDTTRSSNASDTRFEMTDERLQYLKRNNYQAVGRYLTGGDFKELRIGEADKIIKNGIQLFPIFQESGTDLTYFTEDRGKSDAKNAVKAARKKGIPGDNIIYFAVDTDPLDDEIEEYIKPYFKGISENISKAYRVGIYGTRNVCNKVIESGYAETCFVSDMSYGYSGNMGFKIPRNWNLDQFKELSNINTGSTTMDLDKVTYSGKYPLVTYIYDSIFNYMFNIKSLEIMYKEYKEKKLEKYDSKDILLGATNFLRSFKYGKIEWYLASLDPINYDFIEYVKTNNPQLFDKLEKYASSDSLALRDGIGGLVDIGHLAATIEGYAATNLAPDFWFGWGGDLATLMNDVDEKYKDDKSHTHLELAKKLIGDRSRFGYMDICTDADAIKIAEKLKEPKGNTPLSDAINDYYNNDSELRISYYLKDFNNVDLDLNNLKEVILSKMSGVFENWILVPMLGKQPTYESKYYCCEAFAQYIIDNYPII